MSQYNNEIERFIYRFFYSQIRTAVTNRFQTNPSFISLTNSRIKWPDTISLLDLIIEDIANIRIDNDNLYFTAHVSCILRLTQESVRGEKEDECYAWLSLDCSSSISDKIDDFNILSIAKYKKKNKLVNKPDGYNKNIVPIINKESLDKEAEAFLNKYYPAALVSPCPVPIEEIAASMGLDIIKDYKLTKDFSVFGQICFSAGNLKVFNALNSDQINLDVKRGTILIDPSTFWERNLGCVNNTIAHEVFHWYKHRMYAQIKQILNNEKLIACRCPTSSAKKNNNWDDTAVMEWQANSIAPRILMPLKTFKIKVDELYKKYDYENTPIKIAVMTCIADELASFYNVSRQSAIIRMIEAGYKEAAALNSYKKENNLYSYINRYDALFAYQSNKELRKLIDNQTFIYVDGYYVINDEAYYELDDSGKRILTSYAWSHLEECALFFNSIELRSINQNRLSPNIIFHRANGINAVPGFDKRNNAEVIKTAELFRKRKEQFENTQEINKLSFINKSSWQLINEIVENKKMSKSRFMSTTNLGEEVYRKMIANKGVPELRTIMAIACGFHLPIDTVEILLTLSGHAFSESDEDQLYKFCITNCSDMDINQINSFLEECNVEPLGTKRRAKKD